MTAEDAAPLRLLVLGGTTEASRLAQALAGRTDVAPLLSMAGRTKDPVTPPIPFRVGGFGGVAGLASFLEREQIAAVVDATHPFAARMSAHAAEACDRMGMPLAALTRRAWTAQDGDDWTMFPDTAAAVSGLPPTSRRVFLTIGRLQIAAFKSASHHTYLVRAIDPPDPDDLPPDHRLILARAPFEVADEVRLMIAERIQVLVTKNSGGTASEAKLVAAQQLGLPVIMIDRPVPPQRVEFFELREVLAWIDAQRGSP